MQQLLITYVIFGGIFSCYSVSATTCNAIEHRPCTCSTPDGVVSLQKLMESKHNEPLMVSNGGFTYYIAPCNNPITIGLCKSLDLNLVGCQVQQSLAYGLGIKDKYVVTGDPKLGTVTFTNTYKGIDYTRTMRMSLKCSTEDAKLSFVRQTGVDPLVYDFLLESRYACLQPPSHSSSGGLSAGSVMVIIFFVAIIVYLVGGTLFLKYVRKAEGRESIPNYEFWTDFPSLVKDGVLFTFRGCKAESTYEKI